MNLLLGRETLSPFRRQELNRRLAPFQVQVRAAQVFHALTVEPSRPLDQSRLVELLPVTSELIEPRPSLLTWRRAESAMPNTVTLLLDWAWARLLRPSKATRAVASALAGFAWMALGGLAIGVATTWCVARATAWVSARWGEDGGGQILLSLLVPYGVYLLAEAAHCSGILAAAAAWSMLARVDIITRADARIIPEGREQVNGEGETRRGRKLRAGDEVVLGDARVKLLAAA